MVKMIKSTPPTKPQNNDGKLKKKRQYFLITQFDFYLARALFI